MVLVQKEVKAVYLWDTKVRPISNTFTITWTERSNMSSWWVYSDKAAWLTAGDTAFDDFFDYSAVRLNSSWVETAEVKQSWWVLDITQLWTLTSGDNIMIKFPARWIKMTKSWSSVTLSITADLGKESEWYQYYAHSVGSLSNPWETKSAFYLGAYLWYSDGSKWLSLSWKTPTASKNNYQINVQATANWSWYKYTWFYQREFVNALYMMKYGNPNSKSVIWWWISNWSKANTWWTNGQTNATYWASWTTTQMKLFWLEDRWGNLAQFIWGVYCDSSWKLYVKLNWDELPSWWEDTWVILPSNYIANWWNITSIVGNNKWMFVPATYESSSTFDTYYSSAAEIATWSNYLFKSWQFWYYNSSLKESALTFYRTMQNTSNAYVWARLMYIPWLS